MEIIKRTNYMSDSNSPHPVGSRNYYKVKINKSCSISISVTIFNHVEERIILRRG